METNLTIELKSTSKRFVTQLRSVALLILSMLGVCLPSTASAGLLDDIGSALKESAKSVAGVVDGAITKAKQQGEVKMSPEEFVRRHEANEAARKGNAKIHDAVVANDLVAFDAELRNRSAINAPNGSGMTPLFLASVFGRVEMVDKLIALRANIDQRDALGYSPLFQSWIALQYATTVGATDYAARLMTIQKKLVDRGATYESANKYGVTAPLFWLLETNSDRAYARGRMEEIPDIGLDDEAVWAGMLNRMNLNRTYDFTGEIFANGSTLLHVAAKGCRVNLVKMLLRNGANGSIRNEAQRPCTQLGLKNDHDNPGTCVGSSLVGRTAAEEALSHAQRTFLVRGAYDSAGALTWTDVSPRCKATYDALTGR